MAVAFFLLCRQCGVAPLWPCLLFVVANPRWLALSATAHAEPLAMLFVLLCLVAWRRGSLVAAALWLSLAALTRFPAVLWIAGLIAGLWLERRRVPVGAALALALPFVALAGFDAYLHWRVPGFAGILGAHGFWWQPQWSLPFLGMFRHLDAFPTALPVRGAGGDHHVPGVVLDKRASDAVGRGLNEGVAQDQDRQAQDDQHPVRHVAAFGHEIVRFFVI